MVEIGDRYHRLSGSGRGLHGMRLLSAAYRVVKIGRMRSTFSGDDCSQAPTTSPGLATRFNHSRICPCREEQRHVHRVGAYARNDMIR